MILGPAYFHRHILFGYVVSQFYNWIQICEYGRGVAGDPT